MVRRSLLWGGAAVYLGAAYATYRYFPPSSDQSRKGGLEIPETLHDPFLQQYARVNGVYVPRFSSTPAISKPACESCHDAPDSRTFSSIASKYDAWIDADETLMGLKVHARPALRPRLQCAMHVT